jgi:hypothetical protein
LPQAIRLVCLVIGVAVVAAMHLHALGQARHGVAHVSHWPAAAIVTTTSGHDDVHVHIAPDDVTEADAGDLDADAGKPLTHHHHGGGEPTSTMPALDRVMPAALVASSAAIRPGMAQPLPQISRDGPEDPPKRTLTVV